jgi:hypothetical protein
MDCLAVMGFAKTIRLGSPTARQAVQNKFALQAKRKTKFVLTFS